MMSLVIQWSDVSRDSVTVIDSLYVTILCLVSGVYVWPSSVCVESLEPISPFSVCRDVGILCLVYGVYVSILCLCGVYVSILCLCYVTIL